MFNGKIRTIEEIKEESFGSFMRRHWEDEQLYKEFRDEEMGKVQEEEMESCEIVLTDVFKPWYMYDEGDRLFTIIYQQDVAVIDDEGTYTLATRQVVAPTDIALAIDPFLLQDDNADLTLAIRSIYPDKVSGVWLQHTTNTQREATLNALKFWTEEEMI